MPENCKETNVLKSVACTASLDYVKIQAVIKSAASAASLRGGRASGRLDHGFFRATFGRASGQRIVKISDSVQGLGKALDMVLDPRNRGKV